MSITRVFDQIGRGYISGTGYDQRNYREYEIDLPTTFRGSRENNRTSQVSPRRGLSCFGKKGKLSPRYIGPFDIIKKIGEVAYHLALPLRLSNLHDVFHVSMLRKYESDPSHVLEWSELELEVDVSYGEEPIRILDSRDQVLRGKTIPLVQVLWSNQGSKESTWERKDEVREKYPHLFPE
ncbi:uncharacterized protein LOC131306811 [Rhododendron vialii]|uniref:uncharacterized protein LOC131306811 n=1 Tax=Rhododendron vialii TaxID=182163 RepID=UPI00265E8E56|nr:uncharacterized protein LOC131306811 [Rhododendron vialii]